MKIPMMRFVVVFVLCAMLMVPASWAALSPMPKIVAMKPAELEALTVPYTLSFPDQDKYLNLTMRLPKSWVARPAGSLKNLNSIDRLYGELAWYDAPGEGKTRPFITFRSIALDFEITAKSWLIQHIFENAYTLRSLNERSMTDVEAVYVTYDKLVTYITWARAVQVGPRIILIEYALPSALIKTQQDLQTYVMNSINPSKSTDQGRVEALKAFAFLDVATFQYPESWNLYRKIINSPNYFRVALFNASENQSPTVQINVQALRIGGSVPLDTIEEEEQKFTKVYQILLRNRLPAPNFVPDSARAQNVRTMVYEVSARPAPNEVDQIEKKAINREYWVTRFDRNGTAYAVSMLLPARKNIYMDWARGTRAYQYIIETMAGNLIGMAADVEKGRKVNDTAIPFLE